MSNNDKIGKCPLCNREEILTFHHLIPKTLHKNKWFKKNFTKQEMNTGILICRKCHNGIHDLYDEKKLGKELNSFDKIYHDPAIKKHCAWVSKQK